MAAQGVGALGLDEVAEKIVFVLEAAEHRQAHAGVADHFDLVVDETPEKRAVRRKPELLADGAVQLVDFRCYQSQSESVSRSCLRASTRSSISVKTGSSRNGSSRLAWR